MSTKEIGFWAFIAGCALLILCGGFNVFTSYRTLWVPVLGTILAFSGMGIVILTAAKKGNTA